MKKLGPTMPLYHSMNSHHFLANQSTWYFLYSSLLFTFDFLRRPYYLCFLLSRQFVAYQNSYRQSTCSYNSHQSCYFRHSSPSNFSKIFAAPSPKSIISMITITEFITFTTLIIFLSPWQLSSALYCSLSTFYRNRLCPCHPYACTLPGIFSAY